MNFTPQCTPGLAGTTNLVLQTRPFDMFINLNGLKTTYSGQTDPQTIADISSGALYVFFRANTNVATDFIQVESDSFARLRYKD